MFRTPSDQLDRAKSRRKPDPDQLGLGLGEWGVRLLASEERLPVRPLNVGGVPADSAETNGPG